MSAGPSNTVVVIGAGIVGMSTALWLQTKGFDVTVIERGEPGMGASFGNACTFACYANIPVARPGIVREIPRLLWDDDSPFTLRWRYLPRLMPWLVPFLFSSRSGRARRISAHLSSQLEHADEAWRPLYRLARAQDLLVENGCLYLYGSERSFQGAQFDIEMRHVHGIEMKVLSAGEVSELEPNLATVYHKGLLFPGAHHFRDPLELLERFVGAFTRQGGTLVRGEARTIIRTSPRTIEVGTDTHNRCAEKVVVCAGAWSRPLAKSVGDSIRLDTERGYHVMFPDDKGRLNRPVGWADGGFYLTPMAQGLRAAGTVEMGGLDPRPNPRRLRFLEDHARRLIPDLGPSGSGWLGFRPSMPESMPVIGPSRQDRAVYYAFGHGHIGLTLAGITGRLISEMMNGEKPSLDVSAFQV